MTPAQQAEFDQLEAADNAPPPARMSKEQATEMSNRDAYREVFDEASGFDKFFAGVGKPVLQFADTLGIGRNLNRPKTDAEKREATDMMSEQHGLASGAGEVVGDVAMMMLPAGGVAKGIAGVTKGAPKLVQAGSILAGESALTGAYEGVKTPEAGETRMENATEAAKWSAILGAPFAGLRHAKAPVSDAAQELLDEGIPLTPAMTGGGWREGAEKFMSVIPFLGAKVKKMQDAALDSWNKNMMNKTVPLRPKIDGDESLRDMLEMAGVKNPTAEDFARMRQALESTAPDVTGAGHTGFAELQKQFKQAYTEVWDEVTPQNIRFNGFTKGLDDAGKLIDGLPADSLPAAKSAAKKLEDTLAQFKQTGETGLLESMDDTLRESAAGAVDHLTGRYYAALRKALKDGIDPQAVKNLESVDGSYRKFKVLEKAGSYVKPQETGAVFTPRNLQSAVKAKNDPRLTTTGKGAMQREADVATDTIAKPMSGRSEISVGSDIGKWGTLLGVGATGGGALIPLAGARVALNEGMRKFLTGTPMNDLKLPAVIERMMRQAGVASIDQIKDPVFKQAVIEEVESEMANETTE